MRIVVNLLVCLCLVPLSALSQERTRTVMVGPYADQFRIVIAFIEPSDQSYKMQSMIIDAKPEKKEQPVSFQVDLTSTLRSLTTGEKIQKIFLLRWKKTGEIELKCDGKWVKHNTGPAIDKVVEATRAVLRNVPLDSKTPIEVTLPEDIEKMASSILDALSTETFPCLRSLK